jgi:hypothetical protein
MPKPVYVCLVEVLPLEGCELDPSLYKAAFVRGYVATENEQEARMLMQESLAQDKFKVVAFEWCIAGRETEWENPDDADAERLMSEAESKGGVIYGRFDSWRPDAPGTTD